MNNEIQKAVAIGFSTEEVAKVLEIMEVPEMPGFHPDDLNRMQQEQKQLALQVAHRALVARQLLQADEQGGFQPHPLLLQLFLPNIMPRHSILLVEKSDGGKERTYFFHSLENIHVLRWVTSLGVHEFILLPDKDSLKKAVIDLIDLEVEPASNCPSCTMDGTVFEHALDIAAQEGRSATESVLVENGVELETAAALASSMAGGQIYQTLIAVRNDATETARPDVFSIMRGMAGDWFVDMPAADSGNTKIHLEPASRAELEVRVERFMAAY